MSTENIERHKCWQSYVWHNDKCFFVSTIRRKYDTYEGKVTGMETLVWEYDFEARKCGNLIGQMGGVVDHQRICRCLIADGVMLDEDNPMHRRFG